MLRITKAIMMSMNHRCEALPDSDYANMVVCDDNITSILGCAFRAGMQGFLTIKKYLGIEIEGNYCRRHSLRGVRNGGVRYPHW